MRASPTATIVFGRSESVKKPLDDVYSFTLKPCTAHAVAQVDAVGEHGECGGFEAELAVFGVGGFGPAESPALKAFCVYSEAGSIPVEKF